MTAAYTIQDQGETVQPAASRRYSRAETTRRVTKLREARSAGASERAHARDTGVPRSTLRHWNARRRQLEAAGVPAFLETEEGVEWCGRLVWSLMFVMSLRCPAGLRCIGEVLELAKLDAVVASSFGSLQAMALKMLTEVNAVGSELQEQLAETAQAAQTSQGQGKRRISVCEDETFHPAICLVAVEPASNFILFEQYTPSRDAVTWTSAMENALKNLPFEVVQAISDEAKALKKHAKDGLSAHHSPDLFHVQHELVKATSLRLIKRQRDATKEMERAHSLVAKARQKLMRSQKPGQLCTKSKDCRAEFNAAKQVLVQAERRLEQCTADREEASTAIRSISSAYHPYELKTGRKRTGAEAQKLITDAFFKLDNIAERAGLSDNTRKRIDKAWRVVDAMLDTLNWAHMEMDIRLSAVTLSPMEKAAVRTKLLPGLYIEMAAAKASKAEKRRELRAISANLLAEFDAAMAVVADFNPRRRKELFAAAKESALAFQRSSSCVEGRNGHLALFHHGTHRLGPAKLRALTVVHNFHVSRIDGSTAAERLFRRTHEPLFEAVLRRLPGWPRPAKKRSLHGRRGGGLNVA